MKTFKKNYDEDSTEEQIFEVDIDYPKELHDLDNDLPVLAERMKTDKCNKPVCNLHDENNYILHIRALKQALGHELILIIEIDQETWLE